jgi:thymidylate synthase
MIKNEDIVFIYFKKLYEKLQNNEIIKDKSGVEILELLYPIIELNPLQSNLDFKVKKTNEEYVKKELEWYLSEDLSIKEIGKTAKIWNDVASIYQEVNSNYGWVIFSKDNHFQYKHCLDELVNNEYSRRAIMIYQRPSMWYDYKQYDMNDFICTDGVQCFIRDNKLIYIIKQRSTDFIFGFFNDFAWHCYVYNKLYNELKIRKYNTLQIDKIVYIPFSLHIYSRHFELLKKIIKEF